MSKSVVIAIPTRGQIHHQLIAKVGELRTVALSKGINMGLLTSSLAPVSANRNHIVRTFLGIQTNPEWLLMIDDDIVPPSNLLDMLDHGVDVVGANCRVPNLELVDGIPHFTTRSIACMDTGTDKGFLTLGPEGDTGLQQVDVIGTGAILIHRRVLEKMDELDIPWFNFHYDKYDNIKLSEDYDFCLKARNLGFKIYLDGDMRCSHYKLLPI